MRFECQPRCIRCCTRKGVVYVTAEDIARIARNLGLSGAEFRRRHICCKPPLLRLRVGRNKLCPFLFSDGCSIHQVKPLQCSSFPFWPELLASASERRKTAKFCPGMNRGKLVDLDSARAIASQVRRAFKQQYEDSGL
jgi:hypothetical protein